jgi:cardiolipin synthase
MNIPNLLSLLRMALVPMFVVSILEGRPGRALAVFVVAGVTDALDGFVARFWGQQTSLGAYLDPAADKLLLVSAYVVLAIPNLHSGVTVPAWISGLVITRDIVIVVVALILHLASGMEKFPPSPVSKVNTAVQLAAVVLVLLSGLSSGFEIPATFAVYLVAALTLASGIDYVYRSNKMVATT